MKKRIFIAFRVSEEVKESLRNVQKKLQEKNTKAHITWSKPQGFHVTLQFLGEIEEFQLAKVKEILLDLVATYPHFKMWTAGLDAFPKQSQAKIIHVRVEEEKNALKSLQEDLAKTLEAEGLIKEVHPWQAHITLGRNRGDHKIQGFETIDVEQKVWQVNTVEIMESDIHAGGSHYTVLESYELNKKTPV